MDKFTIFKTPTKKKILIVRQPATYLERFTSGPKKGKVKRKRDIRYVENLSSIFVDEQKIADPDATRTHIYMPRGEVRVNNDNITLLEFMQKHPDNIANGGKGGKSFKEHDIAQEEVFEIEAFEKTNKMQNNIISSDDKTIRLIAVWFLGDQYVNSRIPTIKKTLITRISHDDKFIDSLQLFLDEKSHEEKLTATVALKENIIEINGGKIIAWADSSEVIYAGSQSKDVIKEYAVWMKTDEEGRAHLKALTEKIELINK